MSVIAQSHFAVVALSFSPESGVNCRSGAYIMVEWGGVGLGGEEEVLGRRWWKWRMAQC